MFTALNYTMFVIHNFSCFTSLALTVASLPSVRKIKQKQRHYTEKFHDCALRRAPRRRDAGQVCPHLGTGVQLCRKAACRSGGAIRTGAPSHGRCHARVPPIQRRGFHGQAGPPTTRLRTRYIEARPRSNCKLAFPRCLQMTQERDSHRRQAWSGNSNTATRVATSRMKWAAGSWNIINATCSSS